MDPDDIYILEAVPEYIRQRNQSQKKIRLNRWGQLSNFIGPSRIFDLVAYRQVIYSQPRDRNIIEQIISEKLMDLTGSSENFFKMSLE